MVGGSKVNELEVLSALSEQVDTLVLGGGIANAFLASGLSVGQSLYEPELIEAASALWIKRAFLASGCRGG